MVCSLFFMAVLKLLYTLVFIKGICLAQAMGLCLLHQKHLEGQASPQGCQVRGALALAGGAGQDVVAL